MEKRNLLFPILAGAMFGVAGVFVRTLTAAGINNVTLLGLRMIFALLELGILILIKDRALFRIRPKDILLFVGTGITGMMALVLCYNMAINLLTLSLAALLLGTAPVFVIFLAAVLFKERITARKILCLALAVFGCLLASGLAGLDTVTVSAAGILFAVAAAFFNALYSIFSKIASSKGYHTYTILFYSFILIAIVILPLSDYGQIADFVLEKPGVHILILLLHSLFTAVLPYMFITIALARIDAGIVSILASGAEPTAAALFGLFFYQETLSPLMIAGVVIVIAALALLCTGEKDAQQTSGRENKPK